MMDRPSFFKLIDGALPLIIVYPDVIPEGVKMPSASYSHITGNGSRILNGEKVNQWDTWRVIISGESRGDCDKAIALLKKLDNTKNQNFKNIFIQVIQDIPSLPDDDLHSSFVDFKTYG